MPPKARSSSKKPTKKKASKAADQEILMQDAAKEAQKMYKRHEEERDFEEKMDKGDRDFQFLDSNIEKERLTTEKKAFLTFKKELVEEELLAYQEHNKHLNWLNIPEASNLPDVNSEAQINTFLGVWKDEQEAFCQAGALSSVYASKDKLNEGSAVRLRFYRHEQTVPVVTQKKVLESQLLQCIDAYRLGEELKIARDKRSGSQSKDWMEFYNRNLNNVYEQILRTMDFISIQLLLYYDKLVDAEDGETYMRAKPERLPILKFGQWIKAREMTRSFTSLTFPDLELRLDPKANTYPKLPKALGLSKENVSIRAVQLAFNPFVTNTTGGREYYALNCVLKIDLISFTDRPNKQGRWLLRSETENARTLCIEDYPPNSTEARSEDPAFRISFEVPNSIIIRTGTLVIGKWLPDAKEWEPCTHTSFNVQFSGTSRAEPNPRRATFLVNELSQFAVLHETTYDAPFESWSVNPVRYDQVVIVLEGKRRDDSGDRIFRILAEDARCKLLSPEDADFESLRDNFFEPATLFRELAEMGFNFVLSDEDAKFLDGVKPKSKALETKAYADIAQLGLFYSFAYSKHNKQGEDNNMALFRMSKAFRTRGDEESWEIIPDEETSAWNSIRYRRENCAFSVFTEDDQEASLEVVPGGATHYNLFYLLESSGRDLEDLQSQFRETNFLLSRCIYKILCLVRPLSWG